MSNTVVVLIRPKLDQTNRQELCEVCQQNEKEFLEQPNVFYTQYTKFPTFREPDLIIRFTNSFCDSHSEILDEIWMLSLKIIAKQSCPLFLCYPKETSILHMLINNELGNRIEYQYYKNLFASLKPNRDYDDDPKCSVYYENNYLSVYKSLNSQ